MIDRTKKFRPAPGGCSVGHFQVTAGTLGCWVKKAGQWMMLSNCHVLANLGDCKIGDPCLQPGVYDGGTVENDEIAKLHEFVPIEMVGESTCPIGGATAKLFNFIAGLLGRKTRLIPMTQAENTVDCALAKPEREEDVLGRILEDDATLIKVEGETEPELNLAVKKSGRTTGTTHRKISQLKVTANVNMGDGKTAIFTDQFAIEHPADAPFSQGGDSGSAILTEDNKIVGLLFAGSSTLTIANRWNNVKEALKLD